MIRLPKFGYTLLALFTLSGTLPSLGGNSVLHAGILTAYTRGWANDDGGRSYSNRNNYLSGNFSGTIYRNFFLFNVSGVTDVWVTAGQLNLANGTANGLTEMTFREFNYGDHLSSGFFTYNSAGAGEIRALGQISPGPESSFTLNSTALTSFNDTILETGTNWYGFGGAVTGPNSSSYAFGFTGRFHNTRLQWSEVANEAPVASLENRNIKLDEGVVFSGSAQDDNSPYGDAITTYLWDVDNDGATDFTTSTGELSLTNSQLASYGLTATGIHTIQMSAQDRCGALGSASADLRYNAQNLARIMPDLDEAF